MNRRRQTTGIGVTNEHDRQRVYSKRRMPYRKKRRWRRFVRKINYIAEKELGTRTVVFNRTVTKANSSADQQLNFTVALYGNKSTLSDMNDINNISALENSSDPTAAEGISTDDTTKLFFQSGIFDMTIRNSSEVNLNTLAEPVWEEAPKATLEVDIYEIICSRLFKNSESDLYACFNMAMGDTKDIANATAGIQIQGRGCTPWDLPHALSYYGMKILKKTKYRISQGNTITYQMRDPRRHVTSIGYAKDALGVNRPGWTKFLFIIAKLIPGITQGPDTDEYRSKIDVGITRKYSYKLEGANMTRDSYLKQT
ncbi:hypothetical protein [Rheinheimera sp.]|uniref:hypothetical protein n=1 Tax=Rheinheimera sp. TaxID=1869214 RepID=UPI0040470DC7